MTGPETTQTPRRPRMAATAAAGPARPQTTALLEVHQRLGAALTPFAGWLMPLRYASETAEHNAVRTAAGLFDLSHMGEIFVTGPGAAAALDYALTGHLSAVAAGRARYTMICAPDGGVLDDLVVYRLRDDEYMIVANAANAAVVHAEVTGRAAGYDAVVSDGSLDYALIAIQGPSALAILSRRTDSVDGAPRSPSSSTTPACPRWSPASRSGSPAPATPARTGSSCSAARIRPSPSGPR